MALVCRVSVNIVIHINLALSGNIHGSKCHGGSRYVHGSPSLCRILPKVTLESDEQCVYGSP